MTTPTTLPIIDAFKHGLPVPDPAHARLARIDPEDWVNFIGLLASGMRVREALENSPLSQFQVEGLIRTSKQARQQYENAKLSSRRERIPLTLVEDIFEELATSTIGGSLKGLCEKHSVDYSAMLYLIRHDDVIKEMYDAAREMQMDTLGDETLLLADDDSNDYRYNEKQGRMTVDTDNVRRSQTQIQARQYLLERLGRHRFGNRQTIDLNAQVEVNVANRLEQAQRRFDSARTGAVTVENATGAVVSDD
jgi:hypothetical protein